MLEQQEVPCKREVQTKWESEYIHCSLPTPLKMSSDVNVKCHHMKFLESNTGKKIDHFRYGDNCLHRTPKT